MKAGYRLWIENNKGERVFGEGPYKLLVLVDQLGSLNKAAGQMGMSYSKAMAVIKKCEAALEIQLLERAIGGRDGGGSKLTQEAKDLMCNYKKFKEMSARAIEQAYNEVFKTSL